MSATKTLLAVVSAGWLTAMAASCVSSLDQAKARAANRDMPKSFGPGTPEAPSDDDKVEGPGPLSVAVQKQWDEFFVEKDLRALIAEALSNNQELNVRTQEIIIALNERSARRGEYMPKLGAGAGVGLEKVGTHTSQGMADEATGVPVNLPDFNFGLNASWEIDVWGKLRAAAQAADQRYQGSIEARNFFITEIVAELANSYYELVALDRQLDVVDGNIKIQEDALEIVKLKKAAARATELAVQYFQAEILKNKARRFELAQERVNVENRINFLLGRYPQKVVRSRADLDLPTPDVVDTGLPAHLLDNRPDVRQAARELEAAKLDVSVAKAKFYPSFSIDLGLGYQAFNPLHLLATPASLFYNVGAGAMVPLLNRSAITAEYRSANAHQIQAVYMFEQTLLKAFTEVMTQMSNIKNVGERYQRQSQQVDTLQGAVEVSNLLYRSARADYMEVLMTRRDLLEAEMELIETKRNQKQALVKVYQALGGGWQAPQPNVEPAADKG